MDVAPADRQAIERKVKKLERVLNASAISAQCVVSPQRGLVVCELTVHARDAHILHALARHGQMQTAVGFAVDKVAQQAQRLKDRWTTRRRADVGAGQGVRRGALSRKGAGPAKPPRASVRPKRAAKPRA